LLFRRAWQKQMPGGRAGTALSSDAIGYMATAAVCMKVRFVKGHCGWDAVTLVPAGDLPAERELDSAMKILDAPVHGGLEVGFMGPGSRTGEIRLRIADSTARDWISMCGGMTQIIGKALVETFLREHFGLDANVPRLRIDLVTDSGTIPVEVEIEGGKARRVISVMDGFAAYLYSLGVNRLFLDGVAGVDAGEFAVFDIAALEARHPGVDFTRRDRGRHLDIVNELLRQYGRKRGIEAGAMAMLYDDRASEKPGFRVYPRFYSADMSAAGIPYEFQCGTGSVAVIVALAYERRLPFTGDIGTVVFEWGNPGVTPDPYGVRTSQLDLGLRNGRVDSVRYSHSVIEILAEGMLTIPGY
jgi:hypothetical protein